MKSIYSFILFACISIIPVNKQYAQFAIVDVIGVTPSVQGAVCPGTVVDYLVSYSYSAQCGSSFVPAAVISSKLSVLAANGSIVSVTTSLGTTQISSPNPGFITLSNASQGSFTVRVRWGNISSTTRGQLTVGFDGKMRISCNGSVSDFPTGGGRDIFQSGISTAPSTVSLSFGTNDALYCQGKAQLTTTSPNTTCGMVVGFDWFLNNMTTRVATSTTNSMVINYDSRLNNTVGVRARFSNGSVSSIYTKVYKGQLAFLDGPDNLQRNALNGIFYVNGSYLGQSQTGTFIVRPSGSSTISSQGGGSALIVFNRDGTYNIEYRTTRCGQTVSWDKYVTVSNSPSNGCVICRGATDGPAKPTSAGVETPFSLYPTVVSKSSSTGLLNLEGLPSDLGADFDDTEKRFELYDMTGRLIFKTTMQRNVTIPTSDLAPGAYAARILSREGIVIHSQKILLN